MSPLNEPSPDETGDASNPRSPTSWPSLQLPRSFLHELFATQAALGAAWAIEEPAFVIAEARQGKYHIVLLARPQASGDWTLYVVTSPSVRANAVVHVGGQTFRAPFDQSGTATLPDVTGALLTSPNGSHLEVLIEPLAP